MLAPENALSKHGNCQYPWYDNLPVHSLCEAALSPRPTQQKPPMLPKNQAQAVTHRLLPVLLSGPKKQAQ